MPALSTVTLPHFALIFCKLPGLYAVLSPEFIVLDATEAYLNARHISRESLLHSYLPHTFVDASASSQIPQAQVMEKSLQHVLNYKEEHHLLAFRFNVALAESKGDGTKECAWSITNTPVLSSEGELLYILHEARELTEKPVNTLLSENLDPFPHKGVNAVSWEYDVVHNKMYWGASLKEVLGYTPEEMGLGGESWDDRVHPDDFNTVQDSIEEAKNSGSRIWAGEYRFRKADGSYIPVLDQGYIIRNQDGHAIRTIGSIIDLSACAKPEEVLKDDGARFRPLLEALPHMAWFADPSGKILYFNSNWYSFTGMEPTRTDGWTSVIHPEDAAFVLTEWHNSLATGIPYEIEYRLQDHHDKSYRWFQERAMPMYGPDGELQYWMGTYTDIDEQKQAIDRIHEKDLQLENILNHSPAHLCLLRGPEHICQYVTPGVPLLYGSRQYLNRTARSIWPELESTRFFQIIEEVYTTGRTIRVNEHKLTIDRHRNGKLTEVYLNLEYRPLVNNGQTEGVLASAIEVTELVQTKQKAEKLALALQEGKSCL
ncbi:PAS domain-containing protein [Pontibacter burrus]|uniref:histidine kinase n=1 Tax=Pontibacter burrus TaxID=2704466 RepID=A0A6B3LIY7_9BACT|nr:PAS domain-containing protein [Pontibacter burrus]NEM96639.1 PAS domain-containing protein [Pontibacter burrus]